MLTWVIRSLRQRYGARECFVESPSEIASRLDIRPAFCNSTLNSSFRRADSSISGYDTNEESPRCSVALYSDYVEVYGYDSGLSNGSKNKQFKTVKKGSCRKLVLLSCIKIFIKDPIIIC